MDLTVVVPTFRRPRMLEKTLASFAAARIPQGARVEICVVDNNSQDETPQLVEAWKTRMPPALSIRYVLERESGSSHARNAGIRTTTAELVGMIDDDEEVAPQWIEVALRAFQDDPTLDFIGGPYLPSWEQPPPAWLPVADYPAVIGWVEAGDKPRPYDGTYPGILMGGNAVVRREWFDRIGFYASNLGRFGNRPTCGEDADFYQRLLSAGGRGLYLPELAIHHWIPVTRMTKRYFRQWTFWHGHSTVDSEAEREGPRWLGLCRWRYGLALRGLLLRARGALRPGGLRPEEFSGELHVVALVGLLAGRWSNRS